MKAHWNARPSFSILTGLFLLVGIFFMAPGLATAQSAVENEANGRSATATPGAPSPGPEDGGTIDQLKANGCDVDDCSGWTGTDGKEVHEHDAVSVGTPGVARMLTQSQSFQIQTGAPIKIGRAHV